MGKLILFIVLFAVLGSLAWWYIGTDSYILIRLGDWAIQLQVLTGMILFFVLLWAINFSAVFISGTLGGRWAAQSRARKSTNRSRKGVMLLFSGKSKEAKQQFLKAANLREAPVINGLLAAHSAVESEQYDRALNILNNIATEDDSADLALMYSKAKVLLKLGRLEESKAICADIKAIKPKEARTNLILLKVAEAQQDWPSFQTLLPKLRNTDGVKQRVKEIERRAGLARLRKPQMTREEYDEVLHTIPADIKNTAEVVEIRTQFLIRVGANKEAEKLLREFLHKEWRPDLLRDYISIDEVDKDKQLTQLKKWHHRHGDTPEILAALEELSEETGDWRSAQDYGRASTSS